MRVGLGYDSHSFTEERPLVLGGVVIPGVQGLVGHSDGDALSHAITDALLGAAGQGDIGQHFPSTEPSLKDMDSTILLKKVVTMITELNLRIENVDSTIVCEYPRISPYREEIVENLSRVIGIDSDRVSIKSKTNDKMGWIGSELGVAVYAVALLEMKR